MPSGAEFANIQKVQSQGFDSWITGFGDLPVAGTEVALSAATLLRSGEFTGTDRDNLVQSLAVKAPTTNTGNIYIGGTGVLATNGFELEPGATLNLNLRDLAAIFAVGVVNGDDFTFFAVL